jgi:hypothetical protein
MVRVLRAGWPVGAGLLAMDLRTTRSSRQRALALTSIASRLAPTEAFGFGVVILVYRNLPVVKNQLVYLLGIAVA